MKHKSLKTLSPKRILVCQLRQIGDVLLSTPAIRLLQEQYPDAEIHLLTEKKCLPVVENNPRIHKVWSIDKPALKNPLKALAYYAKIARNNYDIIIDFQQLPRCKWVVRLSNAPIKLTFTPPWYNKLTYTHWVDMKSGYAAMCKASVLEPLGIKWKGEKPELWLTDAEREYGDAFINEYELNETPFITIDPSHRRETRRWPSSYFAELFNSLKEQHPALRAIILYGPGEKELAERVAELSGDGAIVPRAMLTLREMAVVQERAVMHLGNCSAPRHFAVALDTPSISMHGSTGRGWRYPSDEHFGSKRKIPCAPCNSNNCKLGTRECLVDMLPEHVFPDALRILETGMKKRNLL